MKTKYIFLFAIVAVAVIGCKKDKNIATKAQITGTWSLYSYVNPLDMQAPSVTAQQYPCMSNSKFIFNSDGTMALPTFTTCYISPLDNAGHGSSISRQDHLSGKWSLSGSSVYTTLYDSTTNRLFTERFTFNNNNGQLQLKEVDSVYSSALVSLYVKQ